MSKHKSGFDKDKGFSTSNIFLLSDNSKLFLLIRNVRRYSKFAFSIKQNPPNEQRSV